MTESEYRELQDWLTFKMDHSPYHASCSNYNSGWKEAMLVVKSKVKSMYERKNYQK